MSDPAPPSSEDKRSSSFEIFELCTAFLLGLGATLGSIAGYEGGLWGGDSMIKFAEAARLTTAGADEGAYADSKIAADQLIKIQGILLLAQARTMKDGEKRNLLLDQVSELFIREFSDQAYAALELPAEAREAYDKDRKLTLIDEQELFDAIDFDFEEPYYDEMYAEKKALDDEANEVDEQGRKSDDMGDSFDLAGVYCTLSLFFAGLGLVFKTRVRWGFFTAGCIVLTAAAAYMATLEWI
jgi:hypothetical protein